jgi:hypothetical protein
VVLVLLLVVLVVLDVVVLVVFATKMLVGGFLQSLGTLGRALLQESLTAACRRFGCTGFSGFCCRDVSGNLSPKSGHPRRALVQELLTARSLRRLRSRR